MQGLASRASILAIGCLALLLAAFANAAAPVTVKAVRLWAGPDGTRLVFDLSAPVEHNVLTLQNPDRIVIDISGARVDGASELPEGQGFVKQLRVGPQGRNDVRFVIDLSSPAAPNSFNVAPSGGYGNRLVVDLSAIASVTFFSRVPLLPIEPGSTPPWPASIATITSRPCASSADFTTTGGAFDAIGLRSTTRRWP